MAKRFFTAHKGLHIWLTCALGSLALFWLTRGSRPVMNAVANYVTGPLKRGLGAVCDLVPFSVMEVLVALAVVGVLAWLVVCVVGTVRSRHRGRFLYRCFLTLLCAGLTVYAAFSLLWGVNYYTDSFQDRSGIYAQDVALEDLTAVTAYFAHQLAATAEAVPRDENGCFAVSREDIFAASTGIYGEVSRQFPFLAFPDKVPKQVHFSRIMSWMNFTGVFCPLTGESNLNVDSPAAMLPSTIAHELAHQRGVASEQECNFIAVLASTTCGDPAYVYSGWLLGYVHLSNALYAADKTAWQAVWDSLPPTVQTDIRTGNAYWAQFKSPATEVSQKVYDNFLKSYGESRGIQSYGTVVDLLVVYYKDLAQHFSL